jgi:hypothetical protein
VSIFWFLVLKSFHRYKINKFSKNCSLIPYRNRRNIAFKNTNEPSKKRQTRVALIVAVVLSLFYSLFGIKKASAESRKQLQNQYFKKNTIQKKSVPFKGSFPLVNKTTTLFIKCQTTQLNATSTKSSGQIYNVL